MKGERSRVWEETHLMPIKFKFQQEPDGTIVMQLPGWSFPVITVTGYTTVETVDEMEQQIRRIMW